MATRRSVPAHIGRRLLRLTAGICLGIVTATASAAGYQALTIVSPANEATIHDNQGRIRIDATVSPPLSVDAGDRFVFVVDGVPMLPSRNGSLSLEQMDRGSHTLQVQVVDATGNTLITSPTTTVHLWQASALMPKAGLRP